ncbi:MAG: hypothetical protein HYY16_10025, partial [Planctomycetes bacterium]|nr:hypothetical protein [Planctomycetota bacterium]
EAMVQARRYRRAFVTRMVSARCRGAEVPEDATRNGTRAFNSSSLTEDLERLIDLALPIADGLANAGVSREFLQEGEEHIRRLKEASLRQELAMRTIQRDALSRRRELTASVHLALRAILNAGKSVHVGEAAKLKQYTFAILRRPVRDRDVTAAPGERSPEAQKSTGGEPGMSQSDDRETAERVLLISQRGGHNRSAGAAAAKIQDPNHQLPRKSPLVVSMSNHSQIETLLLGSQCIRALPPEYLLVARRNEALGTQSPDLPMFYQSSGIGESLAPGVPPRLPAATSGRCAYEEGRKPGKELPEGIPSSWTLPPGFMASS